MATKSKKPASPKSVKSVTPTEAKFTAGEIFTGTMNARRLSREPSSDRPGLDVSWAPTLGCGCERGQAAGKRYACAVTLSDVFVEFDLWDHGKQSLEEQLAENLDRVAVYLRGCIAGLEYDAAFNRKLAKQK
jgi:hypothetical protein